MYNTYLCFVAAVSAYRKFSHFKFFNLVATDGGGCSLPRRSILHRGTEHFHRPRHWDRWSDCHRRTTATGDDKNCRSPDCCRRYSMPCDYCLLLQFVLRRWWAITWLFVHCTLLFWSNFLKKFIDVFLYITLNETLDSYFCWVT